MIERIFSTAKRKFPVLGLTTEYPLPMQVKIVVAFAAIYNFNQIHDPEDFIAPELMGDILEFGAGYEGPAGGYAGGQFDGGKLGEAISAAEKRRSDTWRDGIAKAMWWDYQAELQRRGLA